MTWNPQRRSRSRYAQWLAAGGAEILELLRRLHAGGQTIVLVTHADAVAAAADRIVRMRDGRIDDGVDEVVAGSGDPVFADLVAEQV